MNKGQRIVQLRPRYLVSYMAMGYGLSMALAGHLRFKSTMASVGEIILYGALLYHARKRRRFERKGGWLALEVYAGLSLAFMALNVFKLQVWRWHPVAYGVVPLLMIGIYLFSVMARAPQGSMPARTLSAASTGRQVLLIAGVAVVWAVVQVYALPSLGIMT